MIEKSKKPFQVFTGYGIMRANSQVFGAPGTSHFQGIDATKPGHGHDLVRIAFPSGILRNLKAYVRTSSEPHSGTFNLEIHATNRSPRSKSSNTGVRVEIADGEIGASTIEYLIKDEGYKVSLKADNNFNGPSEVAFNYSFEFEPSI